MKVMSYNTLFGGWDDDDGGRFALQREEIRRERPDVLLLQECKFFDRDGGRRLFEVEAALEMRAFLALAESTGQHVAVLTTRSASMLSFEVDAIHFHHAIAVATIRFSGRDEPLTFVSVHLGPTGPSVRLREASYLSPFAAPDRLALLGGDFNSVSPLDPEPDWSSLALHHRARYLSPDGRTADRTVLQSLHHAGFVDIAHQLGHREATVPTAAFLDREFVPFRSDYFLASPRLAERAVRYRVIGNDATNRASDHLPIVAEFEW